MPSRPILLCYKLFAWIHITREGHLFIFSITQIVILRHTILYGLVTSMSTNIYEL